MIEYIDGIRKQGDTVGGKVSCHIIGAPVGLGDPVFDKLHADLGKAMLSINAVHGFEFGSGFSGSEMRGSEHNDIFIKNADGSVGTRTNFSGGIQGGISNGMPIDFKVAFKPVATIMHNPANNRWRRQRRRNNRQRPPRPMCSPPRSTYCRGYGRVSTGRSLVEEQEFEIVKPEAG
jgi:chorismate synthase